MANAKAEITLYSVVDISKVTRYYILKSSTASAPSTPTTNPPSGWTTTEPTYTSGSTNTLYFVDLTEFTNGTFKYSAVSKSSSYEAAKAAYNKAIDAAKTATNFMDFVPDTGLIVGDMTTSELGNNVLIDSDSIDIREGEKIHARFTKDKIELGCDGTSNTEIDLCAGTGRIYNANTMAGREWYRLSIEGRDSIELSAAGVISCGTYYERDGIAIGTNHLCMSSNAWINDDTGYLDIRDSSVGRYLITSGGSYGSNTDEVSTEIAQKTDCILLEHSYSDKDSYYETARITITGGYWPENQRKSSIILDASEISITGKVNLNNANLGLWGYAFVGDDKTYPGLVRPNGVDTGYVRTPQSGLLPYKTGGHGTVGTSSWPFNNGYFKNLYAVNDLYLKGDSLYDILVDLAGENGWTTAVRGGKFNNYNNLSANAPKYRIMGRIVNVKGVVSPSEEILANTTQHVICTLPEGYRPPTNIYTTCEGSAGNHWLCAVTSDGNVTFSRYSAGGSEWKTVTTTTWLPFNIMFTVD